MKVQLHEPPLAAITPPTWQVAVLASGSQVVSVTARQTPGVADPVQDVLAAWMVVMSPYLSSVNWRSVMGNAVGFVIVMV